MTNLCGGAFFNCDGFDGTGGTHFRAAVTLGAAITALVADFGLHEGAQTGAGTKNVIGTSVHAQLAGRAVRLQVADRKGSGRSDSVLSLGSSLLDNRGITAIGGLGLVLGTQYGGTGKQGSRGQYGTSSRVYGVLFTSSSGLSSSGLSLGNVRGFGNGSRNHIFWLGLSHGLVLGLVLRSCSGILCAIGLVVISLSWCVFAEWGYARSGLCGLCQCEGFLLAGFHAVAAHYATAQVNAVVLAVDTTSLTTAFAQTAGIAAALVDDGAEKRMTAEQTQQCAYGTDGVAPGASSAPCQYGNDAPGDNGDGKRADALQPHIHFVDGITVIVLGKLRQQVVAHFIQGGNDCSSDTAVSAVGQNQAGQPAQIKQQGGSGKQNHAVTQGCAGLCISIFELLSAEPADDVLHDA